MAMADTGLWKYPVFLLLSARVILGGTLTLTSSERDAVLGTELRFTCTVVNGSAAGLIHFKRGDDKSFQTVCRVEVETGNKESGAKEFLCSAVDGQTQTYSLTIRNVSRNDSTVWQCQGGGMNSNNVTLDVKYPPTVAIDAVSPCTRFTFLVNETNVALNCSVKEANPAPTTFTWYKGDVRLQNGPNPIYTLGRVTRSSRGRYRCTADNGISPPGQAHVRVKVHYPPTVQVDDTKTVVRELEDLTVQCTAEAKPKVTSVVWTKEGVGPKISDNGTLHLKNIQKDAAGVYVCTATNEVTSCSGRPQTKRSSGTVTLEVQSKAKPNVTSVVWRKEVVSRNISDSGTLHLKKDAAGVYVCTATNVVTPCSERPQIKNTSGYVTLEVQFAIHAVSPCSGFTFLVNETNVALNCSVEEANPAPNTFTWYHGNVTLQNGPSPIYTLGRVTRSSRGRYRCTADNGISPQGQANVTVDVHYPPSLHVADTKRVVNESGDLTVQCTAEANPEVTSVVWTKKGAGRISANGTLHLRNIQKSDAGEHVCRATNVVTSCPGTRQTKRSSVTVTLEVQYAPRVERFGVTSGAGNATVREHDNVTLQCNVTSNPASSIEINNTTSSIGSSRTSNRDRQTLTTMLLHVSCLEGGNYTCAARNLIGEASQTIPLHVRCVPRRYSFSSETLVFTSGLHENVTLSLTVIAFPQPTFTWRRRPNARPINTTAVTTEGVLVTGSVTIFDVKEEDYINYSVSVTNAEGNLDLEIPLVSKSRPHLPSNLKAVNISPRSVTLRWEKGFNGGAKQRFNIQYRQPGGQWTTHPTQPTEDDTLHLDIDDLEPGTVYEIRINAQNEYGNSNYTSTIVTTDTDPTNITIIAGVTAAVVVVVIVLTVVVVVKKWRNKQKSQGTSTADQGEEDEGRVVADNDLYETSADLNINPAGTGAGVSNNDVYAVVNKPAKKNDPAEDLYAMPQKEKKKKNRGKTKKKLEDQTEDIYARPEKKKGKTKGKSKKEGLGAEHSGGGAGDEKKEGQKTGIDEDGLLYVSVDFSGLPPTSNTIKRSEEETEYVGIDFAASAVKK